MRLPGVSHGLEYRWRDSTSSSCVDTLVLVVEAVEGPSMVALAF